MAKHDDFNYESNNSVNKFTLSKTDLELFDEEKSSIVAPIVRVKKITTPTNNEKWKIFHNEELVFTVDGNKLNKKEKTFLYSLEGINFLIVRSKQGIESIQELKKQMKEFLKA